MKCPKCNSTNPAGSKFCQSCGETLPDPMEWIFTIV
ncbi:zinc-ribbon domain-containing protein [Ligilactobacillus animalis]